MQIVYRLEVHFSYFSLCCVIERREKKWNWFDVERDSVMTLEHQQYVCLKQRTRTMFIELFGLAWKSFRRRSLLGLFKVHDFVASRELQERKTRHSEHRVAPKMALLYFENIHTFSSLSSAPTTECLQKKNRVVWQWKECWELLSRLVGRRALEKRWSC